MGCKSSVIAHGVKDEKNSDPEEHISLGYSGGRYASHEDGADAADRSASVQSCRILLRLSP